MALTLPSHRTLDLPLLRRLNLLFGVCVGFVQSLGVARSLGVVRVQGTSGCGISHNSGGRGARRGARRCGAGPRGEARALPGDWRRGSTAGADQRSRMAELLLQRPKQRYDAARVAQEHTVRGRVVAYGGDGAAHIATNALHVTQQHAIELPVCPSADAPHAQRAVNPGKHEKSELHGFVVDRHHGAEVRTTRHQVCRILLHTNIVVRLPNAHPPVRAEGEDEPLVGELRKRRHSLRPDAHETARENASPHIENCNVAVV
mmetsp:Transcript_34751/g.108491  ORF Transcript_34751/g.108491 Transcript_34751/m.108491 type:complete len:260 (+) Transcript_34751:181-960(+)